MGASTRSTRGRIVGYLTAVVVVVAGGVSFALVVLIPALLLAGVSVALGERYDCRRRFGAEATG